MTFKEFYLLKETRGVAHIWTDEDKNEIIRLYTTTDTPIADITKKYNVSRGVIDDLVRRLGLPFRNERARRRLSNEERQNIVNDLKAGMLYKEISAKYGNLSPDIITNIKREYDLNCKIQRHVTDEERKKIIELGKKMDPTGDHYLYGTAIIGQQFNRTPPVIQSILKQVVLPDGTTLLADRNEKGSIHGYSGKVIRRGSRKTKSTRTRQQAFGPLGPNDPSYRFAMGRAQDINDKDIK